MQRLRTYIVLAVALVTAPAIARIPAPPPLAAHSPAPALAPPPYQVGIASWYGQWFQGKETTSGERFDMYALTAAHRYLPFGTRVRVTNLLNKRSVVLRINDRGPVPSGRIIDLSYAAARVLHSCGDGLVPVRLDILPKALAPSAEFPQLARADAGHPHLLVWSGWKSDSKN